MHKGELWYVKGPEPTVLDAVKDMVLRGQVCTYRHRLQVQSTSKTVFAQPSTCYCSPPCKQCTQVWVRRVLLLLGSAPAASAIFI